MILEQKKKAEKNSFSNESAERESDETMRNEATPELKKDHFRTANLRLS